MLDGGEFLEMKRGRKTERRKGEKFKSPQGWIIILNMALEVVPI